jgi:hypothetical protein
MTATLAQKIDAIPAGDGFYKSGARDAFMALAEEMLKHGFTEKEVLCHLNKVYWAVADCFGG